MGHQIVSFFTLISVSRFHFRPHRVEYFSKPLFIVLLFLIATTESVVWWVNQEQIRKIRKIIACCPYFIMILLTVLDLFAGLVLVISQRIIRVRFAQFLPGSWWTRFQIKNLQVLSCLLPLPAHCIWQTPPTGEHNGRFRCWHDDSCHDHGRLLSRESLSALLFLNAIARLVFWKWISRIW